MGIRSKEGRGSCRCGCCVEGVFVIGGVCHVYVVGEKFGRFADDE